LRFIDSIESFLWAILSWTTYNFIGYISSYLHAINIEVTPVRCRSYISCTLSVYYKNLSM